MPYKELSQRVNWKREQRKRQALLGLCETCDKERIPGLRFCVYHWSQIHIYRQKWYQGHKFQEATSKREQQRKFMEEHKCRDCGVLLVEGEGTRCTNCSETNHHGSVKGVLKYETAD